MYYGYPRQLFDQVWEVKPRRQRKMWGKRVDDIIFEALLLEGVVGGYSEWK